MKYFVRGGNTMVALGVIGIPLGLLLLAAGGGAGLVGTSVVSVILGWLNLATPLLSFEVDHFAWRAALLRSRRLVLYRDILGVELAADHLTVFVDPAAGKPVVIALNRFAPEHREPIQREIERHSRGRVVTATR
jgi:hypothetical protein